MAATKSFTTAARRVRAEPIEFDLDGVTYHFTPPKTIGVFLTAIEGGTAMIEYQLNWLDAGLPRDEAAIIRDRLLEVVGYLLGEAVGRPTGPSPG